MNEQSLVEKLGITPSSKIALISPAFENQREIDFQGHLGIAATPQGLVRLETKFDIILVWVEATVGLNTLLSDLQRYLNDTGSIWVIRQESEYLNTKESISKNAESAGLLLGKKENVSKSEEAFELKLMPNSRGEG